MCWEIRMCGVGIEQSKELKTRCRRDEAVIYFREEILSDYELLISTVQGEYPPLVVQGRFLLGYPRDWISSKPSSLAGPGLVPPTPRHRLQSFHCTHLGGIGPPVVSGSPLLALFACPFPSFPPQDLGS